MDSADVDDGEGSLPVNPDPPSIRDLSTEAARLLNPWDTAPVNEHVTVTLTTVGWFTNDGVWDWDDNGCWDVLGWQPLPAAPDAGQK